MNLYHVRNTNELKKAFKQLNSGDVVLVYPGTYTLHPTSKPEDPWGAELVMENLCGVRIIGLGNPTLYCATHGSAILIRNCTDCSLDGLAFIGNGPLHGELNEISYAQVQFHAVNQRIAIEHCKFLDGSNHGIAHLWNERDISDCLFQHNLFKNGGNYARKNLQYDGAAWAVGGTNNRFIHNHVIDWLRGAEIQNGLPPTQSSNCIIAHNTFERCPWQTVLITPDCHPSDIPKSVGTFDNIEVKDNTIIGTKTKVGSLCNTGIYVTGGRYMQITGNTIRDMADGIGILLQSEHTDIEDCLIESNTIVGVDRNGIHLMRGNNGTVRSCVVRGNVQRNIVAQKVYVQEPGMVSIE